MNRVMVEIKNRNFDPGSKIKIIWIFFSDMGNKIKVNLE
jgi:hypothetical protein